MSTVSQIIGKRLYEAGCRHAFGIPGGEVLSVMRGLDDAGVKFTLVKHENSGGFMAEGVFHRTGAPGVLVATLGPGVANAVNVVANALQDRVPMIFLTGCVDEDEAATYTHQVFDHAALMRPITKASLRMTAGNAEAVMDKALAIAMDDPPGPVHIDVPISVAIAEAAVARGARRVQPAPAIPAHTEQLELARSWLAKAKRPVIIAGVEALHHRAEEQVRALVQKHRIPLITTYKAKGIIDERDDMAVGGMGLSPKADNIVLPLIKEADVVLLLGYDPIEMRVGWRNIWEDGAHVIELSSNRNTHYMHQSAISFVGDIKCGVEVLADGLRTASEWKDDEVRAIKRALAGIYRVDEEWGPGAIVDVARAEMPADTVASVDSGAHRILLSQTWQCYEPRTLMQSSGLCTMGCSLPLGIGAKLAEPGRPVAVFTGDACLEMTLGELATARDAKTPVIVFVFADESLSLIEIKQRGTGQPNLGVDFTGTDFAAVARSMGGLGFDVQDRAGLAQAIRAALAAKTYSIISCRIPRKAYDNRI